MSPHPFLRLSSPLLATALAAGTLCPQSGPGEWTSVFGGPDNMRRAPGQVLRSGWDLAWIAGCHNVPLVHGDRVVYQSQPDRQAHFRCRDLATGALLWDSGLVPRSNGYRPGAIAGNRFFLPMSGDGADLLNANARIAAYDLDTGVLEWTWDSGVTGRIGTLQALPAGTSGIAADLVVFTMADLSPSRVWSNHRVVVMDPTAQTPGAAVIGVQAVPQGNDLIDVTQPAYHRVPLPGGGTADNLYFPLQVLGGTWPITPVNWRGHSVRVVDFPTLTEPGAPFSAAPVLSTQNISTQSWTLDQGPVVVDTNTHEAYYYESGGSLRAYDLQAGVELWSAQVPTADHDLGLFALSSVIVIPDHGAGALWAFDRGTGALAWSKSAAAGQLPSAPREVGCILDNDVLLLAFDLDELRPVDVFGNVGQPVYNFGGLEVRGLVAVRNMFLVLAGGLRVFKPVSLMPRAPFNLGTTVTIDIESPADAGRFYVCPFALGTVGFHLYFGGPHLPLNNDFLMFYSLNPAQVHFPGNIGVLDAAGNASLQVVVPSLPFLSGWRIYTAMMAMDAFDLTTVRTITDPLTITLQ